jgi:ketol-acid reductoisomerase
MAQNYFNSLPLREQLQQLGKCRFMARAEFADGVEPLRGKKLVIIGCGAQGSRARSLRITFIPKGVAIR